jgi:hypothetical protein
MFDRQSSDNSPTVFKHCANFLSVFGKQLVISERACARIIEMELPDEVMRRTRGEMETDAEKGDGDNESDERSSDTAAESSCSRSGTGRTVFIHSGQ